jgi:hypothetical protein
MNAEMPSGMVPLDQKQSDVIARFFNLAFNSALLYGGGHHTTTENTTPFYKNLAKTLEGKKILTFSIERESVFIENYCIDKLVNTRRMVAYFKKAGIHSISFEEGVSPEEVRSFIRILGDVRESPSVKAVEGLLRADEVKKIRINYVVYRKVTVDEEVVDKRAIDDSPRPPERRGRGVQPEGASAAIGDAVNAEADIFSDDGAPGATGPADKGELLEALMPALTLKQMLDNPKLVARQLANAPGRNAGGNMEAIAGQLRSFAGGDASKSFLSPQEMMEAVVRLRHEITQGIDVLKATGKIPDTSDALTEAMADLSGETVIRLIRDEYRHGDVSMKRLAQIVRRILPDVKELKRLLPRLKQCLLEDGMALAEYLQLVNSLVRELNDEGLSNSFEKAAEEMGLEVDEIIENIKSDPGEAARLIILASELRKGRSGDRLSSVLMDYVEKTSQKLAVESVNQESEPGATDSKKAQAGFEGMLLEKLRAQGVPDPVVKQVKQGLSNKNRGFELPKGIFDIKVTTFFLDHEIKRYIRYNTPFSTILISIASIKKEDGTTAPPAPDETGVIIPHTLTAVKKMLRDLDLVGVMVWITDNVPFIILPMTDEAGAHAVIARLNRELNTTEIMVNGRPVLPHFLATSHTFDKIKTPDYRSYLKSVKDLHALELARARKQ